MNIKKQETYSGAGKIYNEDRCGSLENACWVIDGASGLAKNVVTDTSDAAWYSEWWNNYLLKNVTDKTRTIKQIFKDGLALMQVEYDNLTKGKELTKLAKPSAGVAFVRKNGKNLEYFILGDCMISVKKNNKTQELILPQLGILDESVVSYMDKIYKEGKYNTVIDTMQDEEVKNKLAENRLKLNTPGGYWVLSFQEEAIDNALSGEIENDNLNVLLMTDGFYSMIDKYHQCDFKGLFEKVAQKGVEGVYQEIRQIEAQDPSCNQYPRFKKGDDTTAVYLELQKEKELVEEL